MKEFDNVHVARTFEAFHDQDFIYLVNEPYFGGDFTKLAKRAHDKGVEMREAWWRDIFRQCLEGTSLPVASTSRPPRLGIPAPRGADALRHQGGEPDDPQRRRLQKPGGRAHRPRLDLAS